MQRGGHADRREIGRPVRAGAHLIKRGEIGNPPHSCNPASVSDGGTDIVNQLLFNQLFTVPDAVEHFSNGNRRDGMLTN